MGMPNQGMKLPTTGTTTTPNGRTFNTNPAANQMMADRARMAREQRMQPSPQGGGGDIGAYSPQGGYLNPMNQPPAFSGGDRANIASMTPAQQLIQAQQQYQANLAQRAGQQAPQNMPSSPQGMGQAQQQAYDAFRNQQQNNAVPVQQFLGQLGQGMGQIGGYNPPANQMMAQMAAAAKSNPQQLAQGLQQQALIQNQMPKY